MNGKCSLRREALVAASTCPGTMESQDKGFMNEGLVRGMDCKFNVSFCPCRPLQKKGFSSWNSVQIDGNQNNESFFFF